MVVSGLYNYTIEKTLKSSSGVAVEKIADLSGASVSEDTQKTVFSIGQLMHLMFG